MSLPRALSVPCLLAGLGLAGCAALAVRLSPPAPPRAPPTPLSPTAVVVEDSLLTTAVDLELGPLEPTIAAAATRALAEALGVADGGAPEGEPEFPGGPPGSDEARYGPWRDAGAGVRLRGRAWPEAFSSRLVDGVVIVEQELRYVGAAAVSRGSRTAVTACGCDEREWCGGTRVAALKARARFEFPLSVGPDWSLVAEPRVELLAVERCKLPQPRGGTFDASDALLEPVRALTPTVRAAVAAALAKQPVVRAAVEPLWVGLGRPLALGPEGGAELHLRPKAMRFDALDRRGSLARLPVSVAVAPLVESSPDVAHVAVAWPPPSAQPGAAGFRVAMGPTVSSAALAAPLAAKLVGKRYPGAGGADVDVTVTELEVSGRGARGVVRLGLGGAAAGSVFLVGDLEVDAAAEEARLVGVTFTPESRAALGLLYDDVERGDLTIHRVPRIDAAALEAEVAQLARWSLRPALDEVRKGLQAALRRERFGGFALWTSLKDLSTPRASLDDGGLRVLMVLSGAGALVPGALAPPGSDPQGLVVPQ